MHFGRKNCINSIIFLRGGTCTHTHVLAVNSQKLLYCTHDDSFFSCGLFNTLTHTHTHRVFMHFSDTCCSRSFHHHTYSHFYFGWKNIYIKINKYCGKAHKHHHDDESESCLNEAGWMKILLVEWWKGWWCLNRQNF